MSQNKVNVGRAINGISINGLEFLLNPDNITKMEFDSKEDAKIFLKENGCDGMSDDELEDSFVYINVDNGDVL